MTRKVSSCCGTHLELLPTTAGARDPDQDHRVHWSSSFIPQPSHPTICCLQYSLLWGKT